MDHYYAECFGYMSSGGGNGDDELPFSLSPPEHGYDQRLAVPRRPTTLQFGSDTTFLSPKDTLAFMSGLPTSAPFTVGSSDQYPATISPASTTADPLNGVAQMQALDPELCSPHSPSVWSSGSSYARSLSDCSPPPRSVRVLSHETNGQLQHQSSPHALFSDLSSMDSKPASDLAADHWAVTCPDLHILSNMSMFDDHHLSADINIPLGIYHDDTTIELPARESVVDPSMEMLDVEIEGTPTLLTPTVVSSPSPASAKSLEAAEQDSSPEARVTRLIGEKHIDGEGVCYVYSDGTHCPKYIKGEPVNAKWGITKAGRPRKRLAQACIACRHRKIKCTPASPKCEQCKRSGKTCRFENAPRGNQAKAKNLGAAAAGDSDKTSPKPRSCKKGTTERTSGASAAESSTQASDSQPDPSPTDAIESDGSSK